MCCSLIAFALALAPVVPGEMARLAGGTFMMGTDASRVDGLMARFGIKRRELLQSEIPAHEVTLRAFSIDRTEVTNAAFGRWKAKAESPGDADTPVTFVTWNEAAGYCQSVGKRLPTEAEWEFAAGGGGKAEFPWGDELPGPKSANWLGAGIGRPTRVASYPPNAAGLHDMAGNVWEFVAESWADASVDRRVIRGGSFGGSPVNLRVRFRDSHPANSPGPHVGFRCALSE